MSKRVTLLVGTTKGAFMFHTDEERRTWRQTGPHLGGWEMYSILGCSRNGDRIFAGTHHRTGGVTIQVSEDMGASWRPVAAGPSFPREPREYDWEAGRWVRSASGNGESMVFNLNRIWHLTEGHPSEPDTYYAGSEEAALFVSHDRGETWEEVEGLSNHPTRPHWGPGAGGMGMHTVLIHPENPKRMWVAMSAVGVFRTDDGGDTWKVCNKGLNRVPTGKPEEENIGYCAHKVALDPDNPDILYMQDHGAVNKSTDGGDSWFRIEKGLGTEGDERFGFPIAVSPTGDLYLVPLKSSEERVTRGGKVVIFRSTDRGESWHGVSGDFNNQVHYVNVLRDGLVTDSLDPYGVYFGTSSGEIFYSLDRGDSWQAVPGRFPRITTLNVWIADK